MSHLIETNAVTGRAEIAYAGKTPWHGLGQQLTPDAPIEVWQREAGLNWEAKASPLFFESARVREVDALAADTVRVPVENLFAVHREDNDLPLGVVTDRYRIHQPGEILDFFDTLVKSAGFKLDVAGAIKGGKRIWALANVNREACVLGDDAVRGYLLLSTGFDGATATVGQFTSIRVVCNNTLSAADRETAPARFSMRHSMAFDPSLMRDKLGLVVSGFDGMMDQYRALARQPVNSQFVADFLRRFYKPTLNEATGQFREHRGFNKVMELFEGRGMGADLPGARGTKWGLLNAMTQYIDHERGRNVDSRLSSAWFGSGERQKREAESLLLA